MILAGGTGARFGGPRPKQLAELGGRTVLEHSLGTFSAVPGITDIVIVMAAGFLTDVERIVAAGRYDRVRRVVAGGATRSESTRRALAALPAGAGSPERVLIHDAARPLLDTRIVQACLDALDTVPAVTTAVPSVDTVLVVDAGTVTDIPDRTRLQRCQTPQGFRLDVIAGAHELAAAEPGFVATDDCGVLRRYLPEVPIAVVPGSERNVKITTAEDLRLAEALLDLALLDLAAPDRGRAGR